jgi:anti-sigma regulatory factor (Ser/Thr protein kinase)
VTSTESIRLAKAKEVRKMPVSRDPEIHLTEGGMRASLSLRSDPTELCRLAAFAEGFARRHALPARERARLLIILEELFTNAVNHGYEGEASRLGRIGVALAFDAGRLKIAFSDDGRPFDPLVRPLPDLDQPAADRPIGGLGLAILRSLVDDARYSRDGDRNHLVLTRKIVHDE